MTKPLQGDMFSSFRDQIMGVILDAYPGPGKVNVEHIRKAQISMKSMLPPGNNGTAGVFWLELKINWNNGYHLYGTHEAVTDTLT